MATEIERLLVRLEATQTKFEKQMAAASRTADRRARQIEGRFTKMNKTLSSGASALALRLGGVFGGAYLLREAKQLIDASTRINNALKVAGLSGEQLTNVYDALFKSAQRNAAPLETLVELYSRVAMAQSELNVSQDEMINFADKVAVALRVSGKSAEQTRGALIQLSQAIGSGIVRAEEFNSILEGALPIAQAAAAGLEEAGGSVAKLRRLIIDGEVSSEAFFRAFEAGSVILEQKVANAEETISQRFVRLSNVLITTAGKFNDATGASENFGDGLDWVGRQIDVLSNALAEFDVSGFIDELADARAAAENFLGNLGNAQIFADLNRALGYTDENGNLLSGQLQDSQNEAARLEKEIQSLQKVIEKNTELGFDNSGAISRLNEVSARLAQVRAQMAGLTGAEIIDVPIVSDGGSTMGGPPRRGGRRRKKEVNPITLKDFTLPTKTGGGGGRASRGDRENDFQREVSQIRDRTAAIQAETAAQAMLNPLVDDYGYAIDKARAAYELETAAKQAGIPITDELRAQIDTLAAGYANATSEAVRMSEQQDQLRDSVEDMRALGKDVLGGFIDDLRQGKSATEALENALDKLTNKLLNEVLDAIFQVKGAGGGGFGGIFASLFGGGGSSFFPASPAPFVPGLYAKGGFTGVGGKYQTAGVVHKGEFVFDQEATRKAGVRNLERLHTSLQRGFSSGGYTGGPASSGAGLSGGTVVQVFDQRRNAPPIEEQRSRGPDGREVVKLIVGEEIGTGGYDKQFGGRFGAKPVKVRR